MLEITKVSADGEDFLKIKVINKGTAPLDARDIATIISIEGWQKSERDALTYALPFSKAEELYQKTRDLMVVWKSEGDNMGALSTGISTDYIPKDYTIPYTPKIPLRPHQIQAFNLMVQRDGLLIADQEGVGKTPPVLCSHDAKIQMGVAKWGLFLTKAALTYDVRNQARRFTDMNVVVISGDTKKRIDMYYELEKAENVDLVVMSYELYRKDLEHIRAVHKVKPFSIMYCDEMHKAKNLTKSQIGKAIHEIHTEQRYAITATPIINELVDAYNIFAWLGALKYSWEAFMRKFCILDGFGRVLQYKNVSEFKTVLQTNMLRRLKTQVLTDLPPVVSKQVHVELTSPQKKLYKKVEEADEKVEFEDLDFEDVPSELAKYARLMQVAESTEIVGGVEGTKGSAKLAQMEELLAEIVERGEKVVVFSRSKRFTLLMYNHFQQYNPAIMTGDISSQAKDGQDTSERQIQVDKFQEDESCKVIFCCEAAAREGWTGTAANNVIFTSKPWSPAYVSQCVGRVFRFGQDGGVTGTINVYSLIARDTIDEQIEKLLAEKQFTIESAVEQPMGTKEVLSILRRDRDDVA
ncbi:hypothetical protein IAQ67_28660 (plasmid) [Paenibacillus peoriae]|uniref:DEAD/DEAH box helicase n=1 Tax=Paenibacillus peoriae TaxID=59893 RepID=A0A7H0YHC6_9BACL|nr:SNF2-related protein [Paenibacillus peoriae]QNR70484.1 hypothetical protein IAQ67_28660 [Paenibacillus peoriae]